MFNLQPPRHISTLRISPIAPEPRRKCLDRTDTGRSALVAGTGLHAPQLPFAIPAGIDAIGWIADL